MRPTTSSTLYRFTPLEWVPGATTRPLLPILKGTRIARMTAAASTPVYTPTALKRWSCIEKQLPAAENIRAIHIYDFDNTLFSSPLPNRALWSTSSCGQLQAQDFLYNGGWWHNPAILAATGDGLQVEEGRSWEGFWNEKIVELCRLSAEEEDVISVMLTGRGESKFAELIGKMLKAKGLNFDMVCLKPSVSPSGELFTSTLGFKQALLRDIVYTYQSALEIRIYEDRPKHTKSFREFFTDLNRAIQQGMGPVHRAQIKCDVIQVTEQETTMDPISEAAEVQAMINTHNTAILSGEAPAKSIPYRIKRTVFFTGYLLAQPDMEKIKRLAQLPPNCPEHEVRWLANNILITPRPAPQSILDQVGGLGSKMRWRVTGTGNWQSRVWAARVQPVDPNARIFTENAVPSVVLATRREAKPVEATKISQWSPVTPETGLEFETTVGEKVLLRIEEEAAEEDASYRTFANGNGSLARKHLRDEDFPPLGANGHKHPRSRGGWNNNYNNENRPPYSQHSSAWSNNHNSKGGANSGIGFSIQRGGSDHGGRGGGRGGRGGQRGFRGGGHGRGGRGGGGGGRGRGQYRSLDDSGPAQGGYGGGGEAMQY